MKASDRNQTLRESYSTTSSLISRAPPPPALALTADLGGELALVELEVKGEDHYALNRLARSSSTVGPTQKLPGSDVAAWICPSASVWSAALQSPRR